MQKANLIIVIFLSLFITLYLGACRRGGSSTGNSPKGPEVSIDTSSAKSKKGEKSFKDIKVNIYIENSGSMDGFIMGLTNFKNDIGELLTDVKYYYDEDDIKIFFIHNNEKELLSIPEASCGEDLADVAQWIGVEWKKEPRGSNTKLNNIFKTILDRTDSTTVSILISDCIYSIGKNGNTTNLLDHERTTTKDAFLSRSKYGDMKLSTSIYRMTSVFSGKYYPYTGDVNNFYFKGELPYYICVFADNAVMNDFCSKVKIDGTKGYKGYQNRYSIAHIETDEPYWTILLHTGNKGRFQKIRDRNSMEKVHGIDNVKQDRDGHFSFSVAVDMSGVNVQEDYLLDKSNYKIDNTKFAITSIKAFHKDSLNSSDFMMIQNSKQNPTHIITFETTGKAVCDLEVALERKMPQWVEQYNIMDDTKRSYIEDGQSFGLKYWIEGISRAYETIYPNDNAYFKFKITIKK